MKKEEAKTERPRLVKIKVQKNEKKEGDASKKHRKEEVKRRRKEKRKMKKMKKEQKEKRRQLKERKKRKRAAELAGLACMPSHHSCFTYWSYTVTILIQKLPYIIHVFTYIYMYIYICMYLSYGIVYIFQNLCYASLLCFVAWFISAAWCKVMPIPDHAAICYKLC